MKVKFLPQNEEFEIEPGQSVLNLAQEKGIPIHSTCNGMPSCAECRVKVVEGEHNMLPPSKKELSLIGTGYYIDRRRLSCQMICFGDVVIDTQEHLDRLSSGPVTKKFLSRVQKTSAEQSYSVGDVLIQKDDQLFKGLDSSEGDDDANNSDHEMFNEMMKASGSSKKKGQHHQKQSHSQGKSESGDPKKKRNRNRNRNRNRKRHQQNKSN